MHYRALATDYDGTLATQGKVGPDVIEALRRARDAGRRLVLATGRVWPELRAIFPEHQLFHRVVAENGALLVQPKSGEETVLAPPPPTGFVERLRELQVHPLGLGRVIVATRRPQEGRVLAAIRELSLDLEIIFNKDAVMVLPSGVNKASGLCAALTELHLSVDDCIAVGDAENDQAMLDECGFAVAVANAVPTLRDRADWVTRGACGQGVTELIDEWLAADRKGRPRPVAAGSAEHADPGDEPPSVLVPELGMVRPTMSERDKGPGSAPAAAEAPEVSRGTSVVGRPLEPCSHRPKTGFFRDGCCNTHESDVGAHVVCVRIDPRFLEFSRRAGNDLSAPVPQLGFPGLRPGDRWCVCAARWKEALDAGCAPKVYLASTHERALDYVSLEALSAHALDLN